MEENRTIVQKLIAYSKKDGNKNVILLIGYLILQTIVFGIITPYFVTSSPLSDEMDDCYTFFFFGSHDFIIYHTTKISVSQFYFSFLSLFISVP